ncbi:MAG: metal ABC transporter substrate-binding protein [Chloroflexia bacterium]
MRHRLASVAAALLTALLAACDGGNSLPTEAPGKLHVTVTTTQIRSMTEAVAGDYAQVISLLQANVDPHSYEPKPEDVQRIARADLVLKHGVGLDSWLDKVIANAGGRRAPVVVTAGISPLPGTADEPAGDPHVWFDVTNAMTMTLDIRDALIGADAAHAAAYRANADAYLSRLAVLDAEIQAEINTIPPDQRKMVTNHDAFGYYIRRYGLTYVGSVVPSLDASAEPSARQLGDLILKIRAQHVRAIFLETSINPKIEQLIANEAGVNVVDTLYGDTLGPPGSPAYTYEGMMRYDTDTIVRGLK